MSATTCCPKHEALESGIARIMTTIDRMDGKLDVFRDQLWEIKSRLDGHERRFESLEAAERNRAAAAGQRAGDWRRVALDLVKSVIWAALCFGMGHFMTKGA